MEKGLSQLVILRRLALGRLNALQELIQTLVEEVRFLKQYSVSCIFNCNEGIARHTDRFGALLSISRGGLTSCTSWTTMVVTLLSRATGASSSMPALSHTYVLLSQRVQKNWPRYAAHSRAPSSRTMAQPSCASPFQRCVSSRMKHASRELSRWQVC
jgi:hypothetical protein